MPAKQTAPPRSQRSRNRAVRLTVFAPLVLLAVGGTLLGARARMTDNQIVPGVHVADLDLGGKSLDAARAALEQWATEHQKTSVSLHFASDTGIKRAWKTSAQYLGLGIDVGATLDAANKAGHNDVVNQVSNLVHGVHMVSIPLVPTIDSARLRIVLKQIGITILRKPVNARIVLLKGGGFGTWHDRSGLAMDVDTSTEAVTQAWQHLLENVSSTETPVVPSTPTSSTPQSTSSTANANAHQKPDTADREETQPPPDRPSNQTPDTEHQSPNSASPASIPSEIDVELSAHPTQADITFADISQINGEIGTKTTTYATGDRGDNIHLAADHINGTLLKPGEIFSYNKIVGPRESSKGFKEAPVIINGELKPGIGGGICQVSSTLYNAVLASGLKIIQRSHHAFPVHYLPAGRDATVVDGDIDFQFQNSTDTPIYVVGHGRGGVLTFSIYGKQVPGREIVMEKGSDITRDYPTDIEQDSSLRPGQREVKRRGFPDRRVTWYRVTRQNGQVVSREPIKTHYSAISEIVLVGTGTGAPRQRLSTGTNTGDSRHRGAIGTNARAPRRRPKPRLTVPNEAPPAAPPVAPPADAGQ